MSDNKDSLRLWLRLLTCSTMIEREVRARLRQEFGITLPRFDMMAALDRAPEAEGLSMGELSRHLMVSNGNVTGVAGRLVKEKLVAAQRQALLAPRTNRAGPQGIRNHGQSA